MPTVTSLPSELFEREARRELSSQAGKADAIKLVATFASGVAATLTAAALQTSPAVTLDYWASWLLATAILLTIGLVLLDRLTEPKLDDLVVAALESTWKEKQIRREFRIRTYSAVLNNRKSLDILTFVLFVQVSVAASSGGCAIVSLLQTAGL